MGTLTIRNLDDHIIERLKAQAKVNHRLLEGEVRHLLTHQFDRRAPIMEFRRRTDQLMSTATKTAKTDSVELIREDRDR